MKIFLIIPAFLIGLTLQAQSFVQTDTGSIAVHKDPRIDLLINKQIEINEITTRSSRRNVQGFRIMVMSTNDRGKAVDAKTTLYHKFPELRSYLMYQAPFFKLKIGNFREREEAENYLNDIKRIFPSGIYVIRDVIEVNPVPENE